MCSLIENTFVSWGRRSCLVNKDEFCALCSFCYLVWNTFQEHRWVPRSWPLVFLLFCRWCLGSSCFFLNYFHPMFSGRCSWIVFCFSHCWLNIFEFLFIGIVNSNAKDCVHISSPKGEQRRDFSGESWRFCGVNQLLTSWISFSCFAWLQYPSYLSYVWDD